MEEITGRNSFLPFSHHRRKEFERFLPSSGKLRYQPRRKRRCLGITESIKVHGDLRSHVATHTHTHTHTGSEVGDVETFR